MDPVTLGRTFGLSFMAGVNVYAVVAIVGLAQRYHLVHDLPPQFKVFDNNIIIVTALVMYAIEFLADKIPWVDSLWDLIHTAIRPLAGALIAVAAFGRTDPWTETAVALVGGGVAASSHAAKAGTRLLVNHSPEPFSNWFLSLGEDVTVVAVTYLALRHPAIALAIVGLLGLGIVLIAPMIFRALRGVLRGIKRIVSPPESMPSAVPIDRPENS